MKTTLSTYQIAEALFADETANWTRPASLALAEWLEQMEEDTGEEMELDVVAIRCDFSEFKSLQKWLTEYYGLQLAGAFLAAGIDLDGGETEEELDDLIKSHIEDHGYLIEFSGGVIVSGF